MTKNSKGEIIKGNSFKNVNNLDKVDEMLADLKEELNKEDKVSVCKTEDSRDIITLEEEDVIVIDEEDVTIFSETEFEDRKEDIKSRNYLINERDKERPDLLNLVTPESITDFIPYKFLAGHNVYRIHLISDKSNGRVGDETNLYRLVITRRGKEEFSNELDKKVNKGEPFIFKKEHTALVIIDLLNLLMEVESVEIDGETSEFMGNLDISENIRRLEEYAKTGNKKDLKKRTYNIE